MLSCDPFFFMPFLLLKPATLIREYGESADDGTLSTPDDSQALAARPDRSPRRWSAAARSGDPVQLLLVELAALRLRLLLGCLGLGRLFLAAVHDASSLN